MTQNKPGYFVAILKIHYAVWVVRPWTSEKEKHKKTFHPTDEYQH
jgi:hypothetical protein